MCVSNLCVADGWPIYEMCAKRIETKCLRNLVRSLINRIQQKRRRRRPSHSSNTDLPQEDRFCLYSAVSSIGGWFLDTPRTHKYNAWWFVWCFFIWRRSLARDANRVCLSFFFWVDIYIYKYLFYFAHWWMANKATGVWCGFVCVCVYLVWHLAWSMLPNMCVCVCGGKSQSASLPRWCSYPTKKKRRTRFE